MLTAFAEHIWTAARPARFWGVETGSRMTVVRLAGGGLFVHSPVALDPATRRAVDALGPVRAVVAPSVPPREGGHAAFRDAYTWL
jgi:hypothetical protein